MGGAGTTGEIFERNFRPHFFGIPPRQFVFSHYPSQPEWQLMERPVNYSTFIGQPIVNTDGFFGYGLEFVPYRADGIIKMQSNNTYVKLRKPTGVSLLPQLDGEKLEYNTTVDNEAETTMEIALIELCKRQTGT